MKVPFFRPDISENAITAVADTLRSGWLTSGPNVKGFETEFAAAVDAPYAIALNSCTAALHLALIAGGVQPGDEVIVPTMTFAATAEVVMAVGAQPVLVDIDPTSLQLTADLVDAACTPRTRAVIPMHYGGVPCEMGPIMELAQQRELCVIEDAAHAFPSRSDLGMVGSVGHFTCFSFYANKTITTGEGGMVTTADESAADHIRRLSLHGLSRDAWARWETRSKWDYDIVEAGWKYNMTDSAAALGRVQLERSEEMAAQRRRIASMYDQGFAAVSEVEPSIRTAVSESSAHLYPIRVRSEVRGKFIDELGSRGIGTSVHYRPLHMHSYYRTQFDYSPDSFPVAAAAFSEMVSLPVFPSMTDDEIGFVIEQVVDVAQCVEI